MPADNEELDRQARSIRRQEEIISTIASRHDLVSADQERLRADMISLRQMVHSALLSLSSEVASVRNELHLFVAGDGRQRTERQQAVDAQATLMTTQLADIRARIDQQAATNRDERRLLRWLRLTAAAIVVLVVAVVAIAVLIALRAS
jgi:hypothetical protein